MLAFVSTLEKKCERIDCFGIRSGWAKGGNTADRRWFLTVKGSIRPPDRMRCIFGSIFRREKMPDNFQKRTRCGGSIPVLKKSKIHPILWARASLIYQLQAQHMVQTIPMHWYKCKWEAPHTDMHTCQTTAVFSQLLRFNETPQKS